MKRGIGGGPPENGRRADRVLAQTRLGELDRVLLHGAGGPVPDLGGHVLDLLHLSIDGMGRLGERGVMPGARMQSRDGLGDTQK